MDRKLNSLDPLFFPKAVMLIARCAEAGIPVMIINTRRTDEEQAANLAKGVSWVKRSKHQDGIAIDIAPFEQFNLHGANKIEWDGNDPVWGKIGAIGEALGLKWGVWLKREGEYPAWRKRGDLVNVDLGHFELILNPQPKGGAIAQKEEKSPAEG